MVCKAFTSPSVYFSLCPHFHGDIIAIPNMSANYYCARLVFSDHCIKHSHRHGSMKRIVAYLVITVGVINHTRTVCLNGRFLRCMMR